MDSLGHKYRSEDAGAKKFTVRRIIDYKIVNFKIVLSQVEEIQMILNEIPNQGMALS